MIPSLPYGCFTAKVLNRRSVAGLVLTEMAYPETLTRSPSSFSVARFRRFDAPVRLITGLASVAFALYYAWGKASGL